MADGSYGRFASLSSLPARQFPPARPVAPLKDFELTERSGSPFRSTDMRGRVWVATYFFTTCPGSCIRLNQNIQLMHNLPELKDVTWVSITCDPDTDTLEALRKYADRLKPTRRAGCSAVPTWTTRSKWRWA